MEGSQGGYARLFRPSGPGARGVLSGTSPSKPPTTPSPYVGHAGGAADPEV